MRILPLRESRTGCLTAVACAAACDIHMIGMAFVIRVVNTLHRLTIDADSGTGMRHGTLEGIHPFSLLGKAFTAGFAAVARVLSAHHDISLATKTLIVVGTVFHRTF